jgi:hypothetical protein
MPAQSLSQEIGTTGHSIIEVQIKKSKCWIVRNLTEDYGIDIELELKNNNIVTGKFVKAQIKSHVNISLEKDFVPQSLTKSFLRYVYECRVPIILIIIDINTSKSWFLWLQKWIIDSNNISNIYNEKETKSLTINVNQINDFIYGLRHEIVSIATWKNKTQLFLAIRDLANLSLTLYNNKLSQILFDYLDEFDATNENELNYFNTIVDIVIGLGTTIWATPKGNNITQLLFNFIRENGNKLNANNIEKLLIRGNDCSRTGVNALGILYDNFPKHTVSLNLIQKFEKFCDKRLHFYCTIREQYIDLKSPMWLIKDNIDLTVGKLKADFSSINTSIFDKWANRGDSVIFDYIYEIND